MTMSSNKFMLSLAKNVYGEHVFIIKNLYTLPGVSLFGQRWVLMGIDVVHMPDTDAYKVYCVCKG